MIPQLVTVLVCRSDGHRRRLFIPVVPVVLVLSPLWALASLAGLVACFVFRIGPVGALRSLLRVVWALPGTRFELAEGRTAFSVSIR